MTGRAAAAGLSLALLAAGALAGPAEGGKGAPAPAGPKELFKDEVHVRGVRTAATGVEVLLESYEKVEWKTKSGGPQSKPAAEIAAVVYGDPPKDFVQGMEAFRAGRWSDAETAFRGVASAVDANKVRRFWDSRASAWIGECRRRAGTKEKNPARLKEAVESYNDALRKDPKSPLTEMIRLGLAESLAGAGDFDGAFKALDEFKKLAGEAGRPVWEARARLSRARLLERKGEVGGAATEYADLAAFAVSAVTKVSPDSPEKREIESLKAAGLVGQGWALFARAEKTKSPADLEAARRFFEGLPSSAAGSTAGKAASLNGLGGILLLEGKTQQALEKFVEVEVTMFAVPEEVARALWQKSLAYERLGNAAGREKAIEDLKEFFPDSEWAARAR